MNYQLVNAECEMDVRRYGNLINWWVLFTLPGIIQIIYNYNVLVRIPMEDNVILCNDVQSVKAGEMF